MWATGVYLDAGCPYGSRDKQEIYCLSVGNIDQPCRSEGAESLLVIASVGRASDNP